MEEMRLIVDEEDIEEKKIYLDNKEDQVKCKKNLVPLNGTRFLLLYKIHEIDRMKSKSTINKLESDSGIWELSLDFSFDGFQRVLGVYWMKNRSEKFLNS